MQRLGPEAGMAFVVLNCSKCYQMRTSNTCLSSEQVPHLCHFAPYNMAEAGSSAAKTCSLDHCSGNSKSSQGDNKIRVQ